MPCLASFLLFMLFFLSSLDTLSDSLSEEESELLEEFSRLSEDEEEDESSPLEDSSALPLLVDEAKSHALNIFLTSSISTLSGIVIQFSTMLHVVHVIFLPSPFPPTSAISLV